MGELPVRYQGVEDLANRVPASIVWEITLACDLACKHCGSRAGRRRRDELSTAECLDLIAQMAELGTRDVGLIGGEAYRARCLRSSPASGPPHGMRAAERGPEPQ